jgi:WhiB family redox-sensing transcriptional regulator
MTTHGGEEWREEALCRQVDPEMFFPEKGGSTADAKLICGRCEVRPECLAYALEHEQRSGVWGGLSERERRRLTRGTTRPTGRGRAKVQDRHDMPTVRAAVEDACAGAGRAALAGLSQSERDHVAAILASDRTGPQVADMLATSPDVVYQRLSRHRQRTAEAVA